MPCSRARSSHGAARQASSSSSCAAKYSPARISSRPVSRRRLGDAAWRTCGLRPRVRSASLLGSRDSDTSPRSGRDSDADLSVLDLDVVRAELDREVELVLPRPDVVLPAVPGAGDDTALQVPLAERPLQVEAVPVDRIEADRAVRQPDLLLPRLRRGGA